LDVRWETLIDRLTARQGKTVLLVDTCHAAAVSGGVKTRGDVDFAEVLKNMNSKFRGLFTFAASTGNESSVESAEWKHGAFTAALLEVLNGRNGAGGVLTTDDILAPVGKRVVELTKDEQHPTHTYTPTLTAFPLFLVHAGGKP
jgi:uncharacterized caspase-like protein